MNEVLSIPAVGDDLGHRGKVSGKKLAFLAAYCLGPTMMDPTRSADVAGYKGNLWQIGSRLEKELHEQINAELSRKSNRKIMDLREILQELTTLGREPGRDQLGALRTLLEHSTGPTKDRKKSLQDELGQLLTELSKTAPDVAISLGVRVEPKQVTSKPASKQLQASTSKPKQ